MNNLFKLSTTAAVLNSLRILVGWHFLYEGLAKLYMPGWTSAHYLMESKWLFSGFFHQIIANPSALKTVDLLNIWGLILIGTGLFIGIFTRFASISGIILLTMYYVANPPFMSSGMPTDGHYFIINKNLIEAFILLVFVFLPKDFLWSIDRLLKNYLSKRKEEKFPQDVNHEIIESGASSRRELIKNLAAVPVLGGVFFAMARHHGWFSHDETKLKTDANTGATASFGRKADLKELKAKVPMGKIGNVEISRIIPGGNLVSGFAHARDLVYVSPLIKSYFTDEKVIETLWLYEACGINTTIMRTDEQTIRILKKFWDRGGKIQWLAQTYPKKDDLTNIKMAIDNGACGAFVMGNIADKYIYENQVEHLANAVDFIKSQGVIAGTAAHSIKVPMACMDNNIDVDFFMKTFHHANYWSVQAEEKRGEFNPINPEGPGRDDYHDNIWCASAGDTANFFKTCNKPWIAYKILAAGAIKPKDGMRFAFENGADFTCIGMFDFQVIENVNLANSIINSDLKRERKWYV